MATTTAADVSSTVSPTHCDGDLDSDSKISGCVRFLKQIYKCSRKLYVRSPRPVRKLGEMICHAMHRPPRAAKVEHIVPYDALEDEEVMFNLSSFTGDNEKLSLAEWKANEVKPWTEKGWPADRVLAKKAGRIGSKISDAETKELHMRLRNSVVGLGPA